MLKGTLAAVELRSEVQETLTAYRLSQVDGRELHRGQPATLATNTNGTGPLHQEFETPIDFELSSIRSGTRCCCY